MSKAKQKIQALGLTGVLAVAGVHQFSGGALLNPKADVNIGRNAPFVPVPGKKAKPEVNENKAMSGAKGALGATAAGAIVAGGMTYGAAKGSEALGKTLEEATERDDQSYRNAYCISMPQLQGTEGCK